MPTAATAPESRPRRRRRFRSLRCQRCSPPALPCDDRQRRNRPHRDLLRCRHGHAGASAQRPPLRGKDASPARSLRRSRWLGPRHRNGDEPLLRHRQRGRALRHKRDRRHSRSTNQHQCRLLQDTATWLLVRVPKHPKRRCRRDCRLAAKPAVTSSLLRRRRSNSTGRRSMSSPAWAVRRRSCALAWRPGAAACRPNRHDALAGIELAPARAGCSSRVENRASRRPAQAHCRSRPRLKASSRSVRPVSSRVRRGVADWLRSWGRRIGCYVERADELNCGGRRGAAA